MTEIVFESNLTLDPLYVGDFYARQKDKAMYQGIFICFCQVKNAHI